MQLLHEEIYPGFEGEKFCIKIVSDGDYRSVSINLLYTLLNIAHEANLLSYKTIETDIGLLISAAQNTIADIQIVKRT